MKNYFKVSVWFTLAAVAAFSMFEFFFPWGRADVGDASAVFPALSVLIFVYTLIDLFLFSHERSEIDGVYRHIPMLVTALSLNLCGMVLSSRIFTYEGLSWLWTNFFLFCVAAVFIARTVIATLNNTANYMYRKPHPFRRDNEITGLFFNTVFQIIFTSAIILTICRYI